jgi:hypothetical protein
VYDGNTKEATMTKTPISDQNPLSRNKGRNKIPLSNVNPLSKTKKRNRDKKPKKIPNYIRDMNQDNKND